MFSGKTVLFSGNNPILIQGIAQKFADSGASIVLAHDAASTADAQTVVSDLEARSHHARAVPVQFDNADTLTEQLVALGPFHIAVIVPGWFHQNLFMQTTDDDWDQALGIDFEQPVFALQAVGRRLKAQGQGGRIIVLSSVCALKALDG